MTTPPSDVAPPLIYGTGYHLDIHAQILSRELVARNFDGSISHQGHILLSEPPESAFRSHNLQLRIGNDFRNTPAGILITCLAYLFYIGRIAQLVTFTRNGARWQLAGHMYCRRDALELTMFLPRAASAISVLLIAATPELKAVTCCTGQRLDAALQVGYRRVLHTRIVRSSSCLGSHNPT